MVTIRGIFRGDHIDLQDQLDMPLGSDVRLNVEPCSPEAHRGAPKDIMDLFGALEDPTFAHAVEETVQGYHLMPSRPPVDFDAPS